MANRDRPAELGVDEPARPGPSVWERIPRSVSITLFLLVVGLGWNALVASGVTSEFVLPPPVDVAVAFGRIVADVFRGGSAAQNLWITTQEVLIGFLAAAILGIGLGTLVAMTNFGRIVVLPLLVAINAAPKVAFAPIMVAWFGFGIWSKVALGAFIAFFPLLIDTAAGLSQVNADQDKLFRSIRAPGPQAFLKLRLPTALPFIFAGLKTAAVLSVVGAIVGEFLGGGGGLGEMIRIAGTQLSVARVFAFVLLLSIAGYLFYAVVAYAERRIVFWRRPHTLSDVGGM